MTRYYAAYCRCWMRPAPWVQSWSFGVIGCVSLTVCARGETE